MRAAVRWTGRASAALLLLSISAQAAALQAEARVIEYLSVEAN